MKRLVALTAGGTNTLAVIDSPIQALGPADVLVAPAFSGINFIDVYFRQGTYASDLPVLLGSEAAGVVESVGADVTDICPGDRVAYTMVRGSHAEYAVVPAVQVVKIPDGVTFETAAAVMLQGTTAHYLTHSTFALDADHICLVHAAAGGAGGLIVQMAKARGARVIATVSTDAKARDVLGLGADHVIIYTTQDFEAETRRLTEGQGVHVVYDSVGLTTFDKSLRVLRPRGTMVLFGQSSGPVPPFDPTVLNARGSLFLTRPSLAHYLASRDELLGRVGDVMRMAASGALTVRVGGIYSLSDAARAYDDLESRRTTGKLLFKGARVTVTDAAVLLWANWQHSTRIDALPADCRPATREAGYQIQAEVARLSGQPVAGWKIAATSVVGQQHINVAGPMAARLLAGMRKREDEAVPLAGNAMNVAEAEFAFQMREALPRRTSAYTTDEVMRAVGSLHPAIEVPDSRYRAFTTAGASQLIADMACAGWFVVGQAAAPGWRTIDLSLHPVTAYRNAAVAAEGSGARVMGDPRTALTWLANELCTFDDGLRAGDIVMTGTCLTPLDVAPGDHVRMDFGPLGSIEAMFRE